MMEKIFNLMSLDNPQAVKFITISAVMMLAALVVVGLVALANRPRKN